MNGRLGVRLVTCLILLGGCRGCGVTVGGGATPYAQCMAREPQSRAPWKVGVAQAQLSKGVLTVTGLPAPTHIAAFSGPALAGALQVDAIARMQREGVQLAFMLGDLGDDLATARATTAAFRAANVLVIGVAGGRDITEAWPEGVESSPAGGFGIISATGLRQIVINGETFVPVPGVEDGRYAVSKEACGFSASDVQSLAKALLSDGHFKGSARRWLVSWQAPGTELGASPSLSELYKRAPFTGAIYAWPRMSGGPTTDDHWAVPPISGPALEAADGSRAVPGFALFSLSEHGLVFERTVSLD
jgi:hypothetical protein